MDANGIILWQASFWAWSLAGAATASLLCLLWFATAFLSARLLHHDRPAHRMRSWIAAGAVLGAVIGGAGYELQTQARECLMQGVGWDRCRIALLAPRNAAPFTFAPASKPAKPPPAPRRH